MLLELYRQLPAEPVLYFGDTARVPYGTRSREEIVQYVREILTWMRVEGAKMVLMACNTSSALALDEMRAEFPDLPLLGLILPGARAAAACGRRIGVIATPATAASGAYRQAIAEVEANARVWEVGCPQFVPFIEANRLRDPELARVAAAYVEPLRRERIDTLIYGCTHYPLIAPVLRELLPAVQFVDPARHLVAAAERELEVLGLKRAGTPQGAQFCVSGRPQQFAVLAQQWLGFEPLVRAISLPQVPAFVPVESVE